MSLRHMGKKARKFLAEDIKKQEKEALKLLRKERKQAKKVLARNAKVKKVLMKIPVLPRVNTVTLKKIIGLKGVQMMAGAIIFMLIGLIIVSMIPSATVEELEVVVEEEVIVEEIVEEDIWEYETEGELFIHSLISPDGIKQLIAPRRIGSFVNYLYESGKRDYFEIKMLARYGGTRNITCSFSCDVVFQQTNDIYKSNNPVVYNFNNLNFTANEGVLTFETKDFTVYAGFKSDNAKFEGGETTGTKILILPESKYAHWYVSFVPKKPYQFSADCVFDFDSPNLKTTITEKLDLLDEGRYVSS